MGNEYKKWTFVIAVDKEKLFHSVLYVYIYFFLMDKFWDLVRWIPSHIYVLIKKN